MEIICYACGRGEYPENTLEGIAHCLDVNPEWRIEMDVQLTKDEQLILFHDKNALRTTGVDKTIKETNAVDLKNLNAAYSFNDGISFPFRKKPLHVPLLKDVFSKFPNAKLLLDIHTDNPKVVGLLHRLLDTHFKHGDFYLVSEYDHIVKSFRQSRPDVVYGVPALEAKKLLVSSFVRLDGFFPIKSEILMVPEWFGNIYVLSKRILNHVKKRNKKIWVWLKEGKEVKTITSAKDYHRFEAMGIDGVFCETPKKLFHELNEAV